ncbi:MAG: hypothetical protein HFI87_06390 [Bacilli bacterium]|nr:hypothetical protein [Bacilli bacterium]
MNKIILLVGDSGSGKDFVLSAANKYESIEVVKRFISREPRDGEENSISSIFSTPIEELKKWRASLVARGSSSTEIEARETKRDKYFKELYVNHGEYSSNVILNLYDITTEEDIKLQLEGLCQKNDIDIDFIEKSRNR